MRRATHGQSVGAAASHASSATEAGSPRSAAQNRMEGKAPERHQLPSLLAPADYWCQALVPADATAGLLPLPEQIHDLLASMLWCAAPHARRCHRSPQARHSSSGRVERFRCKIKDSPNDKSGPLVPLDTVYESDRDEDSYAPSAHDRSQALKFLHAYMKDRALIYQSNVRTPHAPVPPASSSCRPQSADQ